MGIGEARVLNLLIPHDNGLRNRHWHVTIHDPLINFPRHVHVLDQAIVASLKFAILDEWLLKKMDHAIATLRMRLHHLKKIRKFLYTLLVQFNMLKSGANIPRTAQHLEHIHFRHNTSSTT